MQNTRRAQQIVDIMERKIGASIGGMTRNVLDALRNENPKRTGWSAANWEGSKGAPASSRPGRTGSPSGGARGRNMLTRYKLGTGDLWVSNNVPYVGYINRSRQHRNFVQRAIRKGVRNSSGIIDRVA